MLSSLSFTILLLAKGRNNDVNRGIDAPQQDDDASSVGKSVGLEAAAEVANGPRTALANR